MPWDIKEKDGQFCLYKKGSSTPIKGGCHETEAEARKHQKALYANEANTASRYFTYAFADYNGKIEPGKPKWVQAAPLGDHNHPIYGDVSITDVRADRFIENFNNGVYGPTLNIGYEHFGVDTAKGFKSAGQVLDVKVQDGFLWYYIDFTEPAAEEINKGEWNWFSYEFLDYYENDKGDAFLDVLAGGALTNDPFFKGMMPVNFSSLVKDHPEIIDEHADLEHSEPGTGSPPERRTDNDIPEDDMYRREQPPIVKELEEEGSMEEFLKQLRAALGLKEDATETEVAEAYADNVSKVASALGIKPKEGEAIAFSSIVSRAEEVDKQLEPLRNADKEVGERKAFREQFPDEYARMKKLEETDVENKAKAFSDRYDRFPAVDKEGKPTSEKSTRGFSALVLNDIEEAHKGIAKKEFSHTELQSLLDHIGSNGIVEYGEKGSNREKETSRVAATGSKGGSEDRQAFSALVEEVMEEDELDMNAAIVVAAKRDPELYAAYRSNVHSE